MCKRLLDITSALFALLILSPILAAVALAVRLRLGSPIVFRQTRIGCLEKPFILYKFRTMHQLLDSHGLPIPDEDRLQPLGIFLRRMSLDELPQLWNVLRGEMSLVGPRPLLPAYLPRYTAEQRRRHQMKPGITGWAQINGRNALTWQEKFDLDLWYIDHWSLWLDVKILGMTIWQVARRDGISQAGHATMPEFVGSQIPKAGTK